MEGSTTAAWGWLEVQKQPGACWVVGATVDVPSWDVLRLEAMQKLWAGEVRSHLGKQVRTVGAETKLLGPWPGSGAWVQAL